MNTKHTQYKKISTVLLIVITLVLIQCQWKQTELSDFRITTSPMSTLTSTPCPPPTKIVVMQETRKPYLIFVLIDKTITYRNNFKHTQYVLKKLSPILYPGDRLVLAWMSKSNLWYGLNESVFFDDRVEVIPTQIFPTTIPTPTILPSPTLIPTRRSNLGATAVAKTQSAVFTEVSITQTAVANGYNCIYDESATQYEIVLATLDANQQQNVNKFVQSIDQVFSSLEFNEQDQDTIEPVFESIQMASEFFQENCTDEYERCVLLLFSDLNDYRERFDTEAINVQIDLQNVDVVSILYQCKYKDGTCEKKIEAWENHFLHWGATPYFVFSHMSPIERRNEDIIKQIIQILSGNK